MTDEEFDELYTTYKEEIVPDVLDKGYLPDSIRRDWVREDLRGRLSRQARGRLLRISQGLGQGELAFRNHDGDVIVWKVDRIGYADDGSVKAKVLFAGRLRMKDINLANVMSVEMGEAEDGE